jgi:hypothetical protein
MSAFVSTSRLSMSAPIHGAIFSSSVPGRKPMSSPTGTVARVMTISRKRLSSRVCVRPAARASSQQRLSGSGGAEQGDKIQLGIHEQV